MAALANASDVLSALVPRLLIALALFVIGLLLADIARRSIYNIISRFRYGQRVSTGLAQLTFVGVSLLAALIALTILGVDVGALIAGLGLTSLAIGFGLRDIFENTTAGILLAFSQPFAVGDVIRVGDQEGTVVDISVRATRLRNADGSEVYIPNRMIYIGVVENKTMQPSRRHSIELPAPANSDVRALCAASAQAVAQVPGVLMTPATDAEAVIDAGGAMRVRVYFWANSRADPSHIRTLAIAAMQQALAQPEPLSM